MSDIRFGTDGWRAIIGEDYTVANVRRLTEATATWMIQRKYQSVVIGHDCRFGGEMFADTCAKVFAAMGIKVFLADQFATTPMVSLGVLKLKADLGVVITASHNPPSYNGYKLKSSLGGPSVESELAEVESLIPENCSIVTASIEDYVIERSIEYVDLEIMYLDHIRHHFDLEKIRRKGIRIAYDAMFGAGRSVMRKLFPDAIFLRCDENPGFLGRAPEPLEKNLQELREIVHDDQDVHCGIANDGDADRIGMFDEKGQFVDSHHILLLLLYYLHEYKKMKGKVAVSFSVTNKLKLLADQYGLDYTVTKIGFKYIAEIMSSEDVLVGGEESGGLSVLGHIPERDGIWIALIILEFMASSGKPLSELVEEIHDRVGRFYFDRDDLHLTEEKKSEVLEKLRLDSFQSFGPFEIESVQKIDGHKFFFADDEWVMIRASGTEPVLRVYAQGNTRKRTREILDETRRAVL